MPDDTPPAKVASTEAHGATVMYFNRDREDNNEIVARLKKETGRIVVPPSGDVRIHAGAATAALEMIEQANELDAEIDDVLVPCGGGGLTAAAAFVMNALSPRTRVHSVEPELFDDTRRSLEAGERVVNPKGQRTICDAIMTPTPNEHTFAINRELLAGGLAVSDDDVRHAMKFAFESFKTVVEPGAAVGIAAILTRKIDIAGKTIAVFTTGGNVDPARFCGLVDTVA